MDFSDIKAAIYFIINYLMDLPKIYQKFTFGEKYREKCFKRKTPRISLFIDFKNCELIIFSAFFIYFFINILDIFLSKYCDYDCN